MAEEKERKQRERERDKDNLQQVAFDVLCHKLLGKSLSRTCRDKEESEREIERE